MNRSNLMSFESSSGRILKGLSLFFVGSFLYTIWVVVYRLYCHPLAKFPGPKLNAISDVSTTTFSNSEHWETVLGPGERSVRYMGPAWSPSHGDTETARNIWVRYPSQPQRVGLHCFSTVKAWQDIYGHRNGRQDLSNHPIHVGSVDPMPSVQTISMADHDNHARQRKALSHRFSKKALWEQEEII